MSYMSHIKRCNQFTEDDFLPFYIGGTCFGLTHKDHVSHLLKWPEVFDADGNGLYLSPDLNTPELRTAAVNKVVRSLYEQGVIDSWVGEQYSISTHFQSESLMLIERAAVAFLGVRGYGIHMNGLVRKDDGVYVWVAVRSKSKPFWPGMLDQMVAGGQPEGISLIDNLLKEAKEEADIPNKLAKTATYEGEIHYCTSTHRGLNNDGIFIYDLWLDENFVPHNTDGEVESFELISIKKMAEIVEHTEQFKDNCNLVNIDLLLRLGIIDETHPEYQEIKQTLYAKPLAINP